MDQKRETRDNGLVHVYIGEGKGKTTAALGVAMRAVGHNLPVVMIAFFKDEKDTGETRIQEQLAPHFELHHFTHPDPVDYVKPTLAHIYLAREGFEFAKKRVQEREPAILILDEINPVVHARMIDVQEVLDFIKNKPRKLEVILTGEPGHPDILNAADLITEMEPVKQVWKRRAGIER